MVEQNGWTTPGYQTDPVCPICNGTHFDRIWKDHEGRLWARRCQCIITGQVQQKTKASGLSETASIQTLDSFRTYTDIQKTMKGKAEEYLAALDDPKNHPFRPWLYVGGNPGSGKTHLCTAVCEELLKKNVGVKYMRWQQDTRKLKAIVNSADFDDEVAPFLNVQVLYIDDLLKQRYSDHPEFTDADIKIAFTILNSRYLANKPTIISSEWDLKKDLLPADEGVFSRVYERCRGYIVQVPRESGNNFRLGGGTA